MVKLRTLGECVIEVGANRIGPDSKVVFALLLYLGLERGKRFTRTTLMEMFWPESLPPNAAHSLRQTIYQCRRLGADIDAAKTDLALPSSSVCCDLDEVDHDWKSESSRDFLPGYSFGSSERFSEWLEHQRGVANAMLRRRLLTDIATLKGRGDWEGADGSAKQLLRLDPLNEEATLVLAEAMAMRGNKLGALRMLDRFSNELVGQTRIQLPATVLKRRITERFQDGESTAPFVGRADGIEFLTSNFRHVRNNEGRTLMLWGDPGMGKSRLITEFQRMVRLHSAHVLKVECHLTDTTRPLSALTELVPQLLQLPGALGCSPNSLAVLRRLTDHRVEDDKVFDPFARPDDLTTQLKQAVLDLLDAVLAESAVVIVVEDVHWLDVLSWETLATIGRWALKRRLLILLSSRKQFPSNAPTEGCEHLIKLALSPLSGPDSRLLFETLSHTAAVPLEECDFEWFLSVGNGNPYYLKELAEHYATTSRAHSIPASLDSLLSERIRRASQTGLRLLQVSALLGRQSTFRRFERVLELETFSLLQALEELEIVDLVRSDADHITPRHALVAEQAIKLCTPAVKRLIHRRIAHVLEEEVLTSHSAALLWNCAEHWSLAGESGRAAQLARSCSAHLLRLGLALEAARVLEHALSMHLATQERIETLQALGTVFQVLKNWNKVVEVLQLADREMTGLRSPPHDEYELRLLHALWNCRAANPTMLLNRMVACAQAPESSRRHRIDAVVRGLTIADNELALDTMDLLAGSLDDLLSDSSLPIADRLCIKMIYETTRGDLVEATEASLRLVEHHREEQNTPELLRALLNSSIPLRHTGRFADAERHLVEVVDMSETHELWISYMSALDNLAAVYMAQDRLTDAETALERASQKFAEASDDGIVLSVVLMQARLALAVGDLERASRCHSHYGNLMDVISGRCRSELSAINTWLKIKRGQSLEPELIAQMEAIHLSTRNVGKVDFQTTTILLALATSGRLEYAQQLRHDYFAKYRRERYPMPKHLQLPLTQVLGDL